MSSDEKLIAIIKQLRDMPRKPSYMQLFSVVINIRQIITRGGVS